MKKLIVLVSFLIAYGNQPKPRVIKTRLVEAFCQYIPTMSARNVCLPDWMKIEIGEKDE
jgi:hypothetical protein